LPQVVVLHRLLVGGQPAALLPAVDPLVDALPDVLAVGVQLDLAGLGQRLQRLDRGHQLHAAVGGVELPAADLLGLVAVLQDGAPAARPGIARARAVGVDHHLRRHAPAPNSTRSGDERWTASLRSYSSGSLGRTSAPAGVAYQSC